MQLHKIRSPERLAYEAHAGISVSQITPATC